MNIRHLDPTMRKLREDRIGTINEGDRFNVKARFALYGLHIDMNIRCETRITQSLPIFLFIPNNTNSSLLSDNGRDDTQDQVTVRQIACFPTQ